MRVLTVILVFTGAIYVVLSDSNVCSPTTNIACVGESKFKFCSGNLPNPPPINCPNGTVCTGGAEICSANPTAVPACSTQACGICNADQIFACTSYNTFTLCHGTGDPDSSKNYMCGDDLMCNNDSKYICIPRKSGIGSTCQWSTQVTTTAAPDPNEKPVPPTIDPITSPQDFCKSENKRGRYPILSDSTCSQYINCFQSNNIWYGNIYYCPTDTYFNGTSQMCGPNKAPNCGAGADEICD